VLSAYVFGNISLLLNSGIGEPYDPVTQKGAVGKNYCYQLSRMGVTLFFEDRFFNPFMGSPGTQMVMDDFNGDNFDHSGLGFLGGCKIQLGHADGRPISYRPVPPGTPRWGAAWKKATTKWYQHAARITLSGSNYANRYNYIDLDPTYKDQLGRPLLRMTYNFVENDYKVGDYCMRIALEIARAMKPTIAPRRLRHRALPVDPQYRWHDHGDRPEDQRGQSLSTGLGRRQPLRYGSFHVPAAVGLQSYRSGRRACLLVGRCDRHEIPQESRPAGARVIEHQVRRDRCIVGSYPPPPPCYSSRHP